jgi:hypothetical protein
MRDLTSLQRRVLKKLELRRSSKFEGSLGRSVIENVFKTLRK